MSDACEAVETNDLTALDVRSDVGDPARRMIEALQALAPLIAGRRGEFDSERRLPDAIFAALAEAGLFRLWLPQALGGLELSPVDFMRVVEAASALDGSTGWLVGNGAGKLVERALAAVVLLAGASVPGAYGQSAQVALAPADAGAATQPATPPKPNGPLVLMMRGLDKITGRPTDITAPVGKPVQFATLTIIARYCYSTPPSETPETAAFVQIEDRRPDQPARRVFSGWMYASSPGLNALQHPLYDVWVINCTAAAPAPTAPAETVAPAPAAPVEPAEPAAPPVQ